MKVIESKQIGILTQNEQFDNWWISEPIPILFFDNKEMKINFLNFKPEDDSAFLNEADVALQNFLAKNKNDRAELAELVHKHCLAALNEVGKDEINKHLWELKNKSDIWNFVYPSQMSLSRRRRRDKDIYLDISGGCDWEEEHGLQLIFRQGKQLTRISNQDGHLTEADAFNKPDEEDELLSKYIIDNS